ncbi:outer membrane beta-barrel protein [Rapidithrix thailandica]|uniref:Outer membrane beta-barrel protein n=1 Tax=Rapidithrix thailandica TaxID=413964 RepID=A0AAW9S1Z4_9BACT
MSQQVSAQILFDLPGQFTIDFGLNRTQTEDINGYDIKAWGSRGVNLYYMYEVQLWNEKFTFHPGFGVGLDRYSFKGDIGLVKTADRLAFVNLLEANSANGWQEIKKSLIALNYFEIPLEIRFRTHPGKNAFRIGAGAKIGYLFDSHTKIVYKDQFGDRRKMKDKGDFYAEKLKYGLIGRIGYGPINFYGFYGLSDIFESDKFEPGQSVSIQPYFVGVTLTAF